MRVVYAGSFDPITLGHLNIIERASSMFPDLHVVVLSSSQKKYSLTIEERLQLVRESVAHLKKITVSSCDTTLADYVKAQKPQLLIRGVRDENDFKYENVMARFNFILTEGVETLFFSADAKLKHISSRAVWEIIEYKGDVTPFVPASVRNFFLDKG